MALSATEKLAKLKEKEAQLKAQIKKAEASAKAKEKKEDTRRKILIGSYFMNLAEQQNNLKGLYAKLDGFLTRDSDRALFNLPPKGKNEG